MAAKTPEGFDIIQSMQIPKVIPGLKWLLIGTAGYGVIWIGLEGSLGRAVLMAALVILVIAGFIWQRFLGGHQMSLRIWLIVCASSGLIMGISLVLVTILFMAVKTGLHGHGPEFTPDEIDWVFRQAPLWATVGLLMGLGLSVLAIGLSWQKPADTK